MAARHHGIVPCCLAFSLAQIDRIGIFSSKARIRSLPTTVPALMDVLVLLSGLGVLPRISRGEGVLVVRGGMGHCLMSL
jgi:hypothetical protein